MRLSEIDERHLSELFDRLISVKVDFTELRDTFDTWMSMGNGFAGVFENDLTEDGMDDAVAAEYGTAIAGVVASTLGVAGGKEVEAFALMELCARAGIALGVNATITRRFSKETVIALALAHESANRQGLELNDFLSEI